MEPPQRHLSLLGGDAFGTDRFDDLASRHSTGKPVLVG
jgi:hypothetical protein